MGIIQSKSEIEVDKTGKEVMEEEQFLFPALVNDGDIHQYIGSCITAHWHKEWEIYVQQEGTALLDVQGERITLAPGEACFINTGVLHCFRAENAEPCRYRSFVFDASLVGGMPGSIFDVAYVVPIERQGPAFLKITPEKENDMYYAAFQRAFETCQRTETGYEFQLRNALSDITLFLFQKAKNQKTENGLSRKTESIQERHIKQMMLWIGKHLEEPVTLKEIASSVPVSPRECQRIFREYLHRTPMEYLQCQRILMAADALRNTDREITEIALACGFASPGYFSRRFKAYTGVPPGVYRKSKASLQLESGTQ